MRGLRFDFQSAYGALGRDFIHVHHKVPVSLIGAEYVINPVTDLVQYAQLSCYAAQAKSSYRNR